MLVVIEGCDYTGKSTLVKELKKSFPDAILTKEPGSPLVPLNQTIREIVLKNKALSPLQRELLFYADADAHREVLEKMGGLVISDRGKLTHYAYAYGYTKIKKLDYEMYGLCKKIIKEVCIEPDVVIYLQGDLKLMEERSRAEKDAIESLGNQYFSYVLAQFDDLILARQFEGKPTLVLDARSALADNVARVVHFIKENMK